MPYFHASSVFARFSYTLAHVPGKWLYTADALSRAVVGDSPAEVEGVDEFVCSVVAALPASPNRLKTYCQAQREDPTCQQLTLFGSALVTPQ